MLFLVTDELPDTIEHAADAVQQDPRVHGISPRADRLVVYTEDEQLAAAKDPATELGVDVHVVVLLEPPAIG
jgi:hypothetical protein